MTSAPRPAGRPMRGLLFAQFTGAFNDNAWKMLVALLVLRALRQTLPPGPALEAASQSQATLAFVIFTLPLMLLSIPAGLVADRLSKRTLIVTMKAVEVGLMLAGTAALFFATGPFWLLVVLGLMGAQSALFSPAKYGILPEIVPHERLSASNAQLELWTFLAIIAGTVAGGWLLEASGQHLWLAGVALTACALAGFGAALRVPHVRPARREGGMWDSFAMAWRVVRADRVLWLAVLGATFYWTVASLLAQDVLIYLKATLGVSDRVAGLPLAAFGLGIGAGSLLAARWSASKVEFGLIPLGALGLAASTLLLGALGPDFAGTLVLMVAMGVASGLIVVPLNALLQSRAPAERRGGVIALSNVFVFGGVLAGSLVAELLSRAGFSPRGILLGAALLTVAGTFWALRLLPEALLRLALVLLTHTVYRLHVVGRANVPPSGGALLVPNHVSFVDGLLVMASLERPIRFVVDSQYFHHPLLSPALRALGAIPISSAGGPRVILRALRDAGQYVESGELVCIFAEGQITRTGMMNSFRRGLERIVKGRATPIVPVHLDRLWGSIFSRAGGRFLTKIPDRVPYPVTVAFGAPLPSSTPIHEVRRAVHELGAESALLRARERRPLHVQFIRLARRRPWAFAFADAERPRVSRLAAATGAVALARGLRGAWMDQPRVGVLLPPSIGGALVNLAAALAGRTSVNLNFTAGRAGIESAARQAGLRTVVTSRLFLERARIELPAGIEPVWIEEIAGSIGLFRRLIAMSLALAAPQRWLERACGAGRTSQIDDVLTVIFSSGSTGDPKGVILTHLNVDANVQSVAQVFHVNRHDRVLGILPLFHSFGYLMLWFSAAHRLGTVFHPNPLDAAAIGELVQRFRVTILVATPTFLQLYMRRCTPAQFGSLRIVLAGAEKLRESLAQAFEDHFGLRPLEGYGATECAPGIAVSAPDYRATGFFQPGSRRGFVGQALPGVAVRIVDPDSFELMPPGESGLLLVRGPNVMSGYLGREDLSDEALRDGWYITGDIARMDEDGFIQVTDRLSRFSKIGGEMVPHGRVEEALQQAAGVAQQVFAVTAVPDERKGERLVVLHTLDPTAIPEIVAKLQASGLPNLFIPRADQFVHIERLPLLGTGKLDLRELRRLAAAGSGNMA